MGLTILVLGLISVSINQLASVAEAQSSERVFELRTYTTLPGRLNALHARFAQHTIRLFERHDMTNIGYFSPQDPPLAENTQRVFEESQRDGRIIEKVESIFLHATDYSQIR